MHEFEPHPLRQKGLWYSPGSFLFSLLTDLLFLPLLLYAYFMLYNSLQHADKHKCTREFSTDYLYTLQKVRWNESMEYVYHVVTERPMSSGQIIIFDEEHHNGVYNRVMTCKRIIDGEKIDGDLAELIQSNLD